MDDQQLRDLKHNLRTPLNHILGYSELLVEAANDAGDDSILIRAESLQAIGRSMARAIENELASPAPCNQEIQIIRLRVGLRPFVQELLKLAKPGSEAPITNYYKEDLQKICLAAERLLDLVHGRNAAASH